MKKYTDIIIDTDPGVDDALALLYALLADLPVSGITTVYGNRSIEMTTKNALSLVELLENTTSVYKGASRPLAKEPKLAQSHGSSGVGNFLWEPKRNAEEQNAIEFLIQKLLTTTEKITLVCMGPTTNIAMALNIAPDIKKSIERIIILGGVIGEEGNTTPVAGFNVYNDPDAFNVCLASGCDVVVIPANVCRKVMIDFDDVQKLKKGRYGKQIEQITSGYITYYQSDKKYGGFSGGVIYDVLTIAYILSPQAFTAKKVCVRVDTSNYEMRGFTYIDKNQNPNCTLCYDVDSEKVKSQFITLLCAK